MLWVGSLADDIATAPSGPVHVLTLKLWYLCSACFVCLFVFVCLLFWGFLFCFVFVVVFCFLIFGIFLICACVVFNIQYVFNVKNKMLLLYITNEENKVHNLLFVRHSVHNRTVNS